ncbi:hypothetical protein LshimejAT787_0802240 [Lyophyllum shimeji]|uniref:Uncharacterized protein n=1 Tax=Lyophyllum shimeji TaxID=47721 RepID=A0A9P3PRP7_LYOSH|nr:hypothetical protein LshimejAT787_0802240 [Lyophyllum shimeji]
MDSPRMYEDEVVADSEDEGSGLMLPAANANAQALVQHKIPPEVTQDTIMTAFDTSRAKPSPISSIGDPATSNSVSLTRPKPRPRQTKDAGDATSSSNISAPSASTVPSDIRMDIDFTASDIADRAKMRSRNTKSQVPRSIVSESEIIELSSDDDDEFDLLPASKAKRKAKDKPKAKAKATGQSKSPNGGMDAPDPKPRPRPRPAGKKRQDKVSNPTPPLSGAISQETDPIYPSSLANGQYPIPFKLLPSQLPPSEPPTSTSRTYDHPPIVTLPQVETEPPSSPSSLFSISSSGKKRKRAMSIVDELDSSQGPVTASRMEDDKRRMPPPPLPGPPPTFFAGSSSPPPDVRRPAVSRSIDASAKKTSKSKRAPKKKVDEMEDEEDAAWGTTRSKVKSKTQTKKASPKQVEVVIERLKKGKEKAKEVFKSREFIDDEGSDDAMDLSSEKKTNTTKRRDSLTSLSSIPDSDLDDTRKAGPSRKRKSVERQVTAEDTHQEVKDQPQPKRRAATQRKGRKFIVSDDEDDELQIPAEPTPAKETPAQASKKGKGKEKPAAAKTTTTVAEDDVQEGMRQPPNTSFKENVEPASDLSVPTASNSKPPAKPEPLFPNLSSRYTIAPKTKSSPMSDLIRRVSSKPGSPFCSPAPRSGSAGRPSTPGTAYSPYLKASRSALSRIAPLHPNRRTPPPPLPPPPPKKKTKKELEREEQWEEELIESVGGITEWACMTDAERREMRRAKREREMYGWED